MTARSQFRKPAAFRLDDERITVASESTGRVPSRGQIAVTPEAEPTTAAAVMAHPTPAKRRGLSWGTLFWSATLVLIALAIAVALAKLIEDLFARAGWLGYLGLAVALLALVALAAIAIREVVALLRLAAVERLHARALATVASDDRAEGRALTHELLAITHRIPQLASARARLRTHLDEIIDGGDLVRLAERELMGPLDREASRLVGTAAKRVSAVTALSPRALFDLLFVATAAIALVRRLSALYGGRPGTLGLFRIGRLVLTHLAFTGGMAAGESLLQQLVGHGLAARLSAKLGEGVLNGILTARVGLATIEVVRPLPFLALRKPSLNELAGALIRGQGGPADEATVAAPRDKTGP
jgi:putative membrane protein